MGNYKFRFADMMPNSWFYKLKDMSRNKRGSKKQRNNQSKSANLQSPKQSKLSQNLASHGRKSYYFNRDPIANFDTFYNSLSNPDIQSHFYHDPPKKSATVNKHAVKIKPRKSLLVSKQLISNSDRKDIIIDFEIEKKVDLAPIITAKGTKPKQQQMTTTHKNRGAAKTEQKTLGRKSYSPVTGGGMKLRAKSPRIANLNINGCRRSVSSSTSTSSGIRKNNISDCFAVVKSSYNPQKDFMESMMEMIVENNIIASKDLEELLACYLSLNSDEYHDLIIKVFKQIWFDLLDMQIKKK